MKRPWIYPLILTILATSLLAAYSAGGAASGRVNCSNASAEPLDQSYVSTNGDARRARQRHFHTYRACISSTSLACCLTNLVPLSIIQVIGDDKS